MSVMLIAQKILQSQMVRARYTYQNKHVLLQNVQFFFVQFQGIQEKIVGHHNKRRQKKIEKLLAQSTPHKK